MNKMNKKGFTLIEMLVVIAIIAVLVSIIIPTVTSATDKAAAATNAANLRSYQAEVTTALLSGTVKFGNDGKLTDTVAPATGETSKVPTAPKSEKCGALAANVDATVVQDGSGCKVYFGATTNTIDAFATAAETGDVSSIAAVPSGDGK